ncbi:MAG: nucleoside triphosphate pyrophosphohydrolase [Phascolarctobacterium sp.]|nr:nucleoside triphosphate pyrophosphohydrolase [Phascolarctobacterium sp.]
MGKIVVVGLGPGAAGHLSLETMGLLKNSPQVILRTAVHPTVSELEKEKIAFTACDDLYESSASFEDVYNAIVARVLAAAQQNDVVYAVPGSPLVAEKTVVFMREAAKEQNIELVIKPAMSFLDLAYVALGIDPISGLRIIDAQDENAIFEAGSYPLMITQVYSRILASDLKIMLMESLSDDYEIYFLRNLGLPDEECKAIPLYELDRQENIDHLTSVYIPPIPESSKGVLFFGEDEEDEDNEVQVMSGEEFEEDFDDLAEGEEYTDSLADVDIQPLVDVMRVLREPGGCPWDQEQDHKSIRSNFVEEVYEFLEAVNHEDTACMCEELGDVLMQVVFHARMAEEAGNFDMQDVIDGVVDKLIRRHPHVFGDTTVKDSAEVLVNWDAIKKEEKKERKHILDGVAEGLPALLKAYTIQRKVAKVGFDWDNDEDVWSKVEEELGEFKEALASKDEEQAEKELGDLLFAITNYARHQGIEPEVALTGTNDRFAKRFSYVEAMVNASGKAWQEFSLGELDKFWDEAKLLEKK